MKAERVVPWALMMVACWAGCTPSDFKEPYKLAGGKEYPRRDAQQGEGVLQPLLSGLSRGQGKRHWTGVLELSPAAARRTRRALPEDSPGCHSGSLPHDEDLARIVKGGLHGTAMLTWEIPDARPDERAPVHQDASPSVGRKRTWATSSPSPMTPGARPRRARPSSAARGSTTASRSASSATPPM